MKKAGAERGRLTKAEKHRLNKQKKKAEEAAKQNLPNKTYQT